MAKGPGSQNRMTGDCLSPPLAPASTSPAAGSGGEALHLPEDTARAEALEGQHPPYPRAVCFSPLTPQLFPLCHLLLPRII